MPRPSTTDSLDLQQRLNPTLTSNTTNVPLIINSQSTIDDLTNSNTSMFSSSSDYRQQSTSSIRLNLPDKFSSLNSRPTMEDKSIQCIDEHDNNIENHSSLKRNGQTNDESWTVAADTYEYIICVLKFYFEILDFFVMFFLNMVFVFLMLIVNKIFQQNLILFKQILW